MNVPSRFELLVETARLRLELIGARAEISRLRDRAYAAPYVQAGYKRLVEREVETRAIADRCDRNVARWLNETNAEQNRQPFGTLPANPFRPAPRITTFAERKSW